MGIPPPFPVCYQSVLNRIMCLGYHKVSKKIDGKTYYMTNEACSLAGISKATLFRWIREGILADSFRKDRNGWRLLSNGDIKKIKAEANRTM